MPSVLSPLTQHTTDSLTLFLPSSWNALSPDRKTSYSPIDSALSKFISSVAQSFLVPPHFIDFDFRDFWPDRFHQVYFQNIMFILVFFLCLISVDYYALSLSFSSFFTSLFLVLFLFFCLYIFFLLLFFDLYLEKLY
jgi:hypothetical protein